VSLSQTKLYGKLCHHLEQYAVGYVFCPLRHTLTLIDRLDMWCINSCRSEASMKSTSARGVTQRLIQNAWSSPRVPPSVQWQRRQDQQQTACGYRHQTSSCWLPASCIRNADRVHPPSQAVTHIHMYIDSQSFTFVTRPTLD